MNEWMNEWTPKRLHPDSIRDSIRIRIVAADSIRDSIRTKISDSQVPTVQRKTFKQEPSHWSKVKAVPVLI